LVALTDGNQVGDVKAHLIPSNSGKTNKISYGKPGVSVFVKAVSRSDFAIVIVPSALLLKVTDALG
jgi:hypothetical protein